MTTDRDAERAELIAWCEELANNYATHNAVPLLADCERKARRIAALLAEPDALTECRNELREYDDLRERLASLLSRTAVALRGPEPPLTSWGWHDLPDRAAAAVAAIELLLALLQEARKYLWWPDQSTLLERIDAAIDAARKREGA